MTERRKDYNDLLPKIFEKMGEMGSDIKHIRESLSAHVNDDKKVADRLKVVEQDMAFVSDVRRYVRSASSTAWIAVLISLGAAFGDALRSGWQIVKGWMA